MFQYDHTIDKLPEEHLNFHWKKLGIASSKGEQLDTLENIIVANGHHDAHDLLLKCDIEGHEWDMLSTASASDLKKFRQIVVETHAWQELGEPTFRTKVKRAIERLRQSHELIHVHRNNHGAYAIVGGVPLPAALELTFVRADGKEMSPSEEIFPTHLDSPCNRLRADHYLGRFNFG